MREKNQKYFIDRFQLPQEHLYTWGRKSSGNKIRAKGKRTGQSVIQLEDGFLRSVGLPSKNDGPLSLCVDDLGIYYDSTKESRLEHWIGERLDQDAERRALQLQSDWLSLRLSKYNHSLETTPPSEPFVLLADQTKGDLSIKYGGANESSFHNMLNRALSEWPNHKILVKVHPETATGKKKGHFSPELLRDERIKVCGDGGHPCALLQKCAAVYAVTSQIGFEALLWQKPVFTFGMPFYSGWGLTNDALPAPERRRRTRPSLLQLVHAAFIRYLTYIDPETGLPTTPERVFSWVGLQRERMHAFPNHLEAFGFTPWKARQLRRFIPRAHGQSLSFRSRDANPRHKTEAALVWGPKPGQGVSRSSIPTIRVEDGFIRSAGLGANLIEAQSWVFDKKGLYYAAQTESDLETLLNSLQPTTHQIKRAKALREKILELRISKYNLKENEWRPHKYSEGKERILVLGQVNSDASIRLGLPPDAHVNTNMDLILAARERFNNAWLVYKPHPDVVSGMRAGDKTNEPSLKAPWDELAINTSIVSLLSQVDRVCTLTSLGGFEALIRGVPVTTWGIPFYAGWGLTDDILKGHPWINERRQRRLEIDHLVYICLIAYPSYVSRQSGKPAEAETVIRELAQSSMGPSKRLNWEQLVFRWWGATRSRVRDGQG